jgi:hypothetical protein
MKNFHRAMKKQRLCSLTKARIIFASTQNRTTSQDTTTGSDSFFLRPTKQAHRKTVEKTGGQAASREVFSPQTILRANLFITVHRFQINQQHFHSFNEKGLGKCYLQTA